MGYIDVDTHVLETDETWDYLDPRERHFRPKTAVVVDDERGGGSATPLDHVGNSVPAPRLPPQRFWLTGPVMTRRQSPDGRNRGFGREYDPAVTGLTNVSVRLEEMDALNIDVQVLISSIFIAMTIDHPLREAAITRSYNRWVAERSADAGGRLPWLVVPPTGSVDRALEEIEFGRNHGAVGVMLKGVEHGMYLDDPYFDPLYAKIQDLDMVVGVHAGINTRDVKDLPLADLIPTPAALLDHVLGPMKGLHAVLSSNIEQRFPRLRWAFLETGSTWVPAVFQQHQRLMSTSRPDGFVRGDDGVGVVIDHFKVAEIMEKKQLFVACETDEDLPYLTALLGPSQLVFGSDYCHNDAGSDPLGHSVIRSRTDLAPEIANAIVDGNGRKLLGIDENFCPAPATRPERVDLPAGS